MMNNPEQILIQELRRPDLSILGGSITSLPAGQWQERMFLSGAPDRELKVYSAGFPATLRKDTITHPIFVLSCRVAGHLVCPCSSKGNPKKQRYIRKGCQLEMTSSKTDRQTFLVERYRFTMPLDHRFSRKLQFRGIVPVSCIHYWSV